MKRKPNGYWTKERVFAEAKKYQTRGEFNKGCPSAARIAYKNNWFSEMDWVKKIVKPNGYWDIKENVFAEARKYKTKAEFRKCTHIYTSSCQNGWLEEMDWLDDVKRPDGYWSKENIFAEAKKYKTKSEFRKGCGSAYTLAWKKGLMKEMNWFIDGRIKLFTDKIDCVYKYYFKETNSIYIGRTISKNKRDNQHRGHKEDTLYRYAKANGLEVPAMEIIEDNLTIEEGQKREDYWIKYYKEMGYNMVNSAKAGSLGAIATGKWNKDSVFEESKKYTTRNEFRKYSNGAYTLAWKKGWLDEMSWFKEIRKPNGFWTKERIYEEAKKYARRTQFARSCVKGYKVARQNSWLDELFPKAA